MDQNNAKNYFCFVFLTLEKDWMDAKTSVTLSLQGLCWTSQQEVRLNIYHMALVSSKYQGEFLRMIGTE